MLADFLQRDWGANLSPVPPPQELTVDDEITLLDLAVIEVSKALKAKSLPSSPLGWVLHARLVLYEALSVTEDAIQREVVAEQLRKGVNGRAPA